jgi:hypothetical protein
MWRPICDERRAMRTLYPTPSLREHSVAVSNDPLPPRLWRANAGGLAPHSKIECSRLQRRAATQATWTSRSIADEEFSSND